MNWTDQYDTGGESTDVFQPSATPFSQQRRKRFVVLSLLLGGGFIAIIGMRTISDGPASASAGTTLRACPITSSSCASVRSGLSYSRSEVEPIATVPS